MLSLTLRRSRELFSLVLLGSNGPLSPESGSGWYGTNAAASSPRLLAKSSSFCGSATESQRPVATRWLMASTPATISDAENAQWPKRSTYAWRSRLLLPAARTTSAYVVLHLHRHERVVDRVQVELGHLQVPGRHRRLLERRDRSRVGRDVRARRQRGEVAYRSSPASR